MTLFCVVCKQEYEEAVDLISHMNNGHPQIHIVRDLVYYLVEEQKKAEKEDSRPSEVVMQELWPKKQNVDLSPKDLGTSVHAMLIPGPIKEHVEAACKEFDKLPEWLKGKKK